MTLRRPQMHMLPAFEAVARQLSFKKAAEELFITPSAVSQQIKQLEEMLGVELFLRSTRKVTLTDAGQNFYQVASGTISHYEQAFNNFSKQISTPALRISTVPYIAYDILIPKLHSFTQENPDRELIIETSENIVNFDDFNNTIAVRIGEGHWPGMRSRLLSPMSATLVASPTLIQRIDLEKLSELETLQLIDVTSERDDWGYVSQLLQIDLSKNKRVIVDSYLSGIAAAEQGLGIMIVMLPITNGRISQGSLLPLNQITVPVPNRGFYFVHENSIEANPHIETLYQWLLDVFNNL